MKNVLLLGSTGSIGCNALDVLDTLKESHRLVGLSCHSNPDRLIEQAKRFRPKAVGTTHPESEARLRQALAGESVEVLGGPEALCELIERLDPDIVLVAVSGAIGLSPSLLTLKKGKRLALANKESLVMAGHLLKPYMDGDGSAELIPVDSEHCAVFQALRGSDPREVSRIFLTASGGPFVDLPREEQAQITPEAALKHPTWTMGRKITIDSATMMNKALEIVEAKWLFNMPHDRIEVLVHRQSIVHGMAEFLDGSIIAQLGNPDMRLPIRYALTFPQRTPASQRYFDAKRWSKLTFEEPDFDKFPALKLGYRAVREEGLSGTVLNAANETAVDLFLKGAMKFDEITTSVRTVMDSMKNQANPSLEEILAADRWAREEITKCLSQ